MGSLEPTESFLYWWWWSHLSCFLRNRLHTTCLQVKCCLSFPQLLWRCTDELLHQGSQRLAVSQSWLSSCCLWSTLVLDQLRLRLYRVRPWHCLQVRQSCCHLTLATLLWPWSLGLVESLVSILKTKLHITLHLYQLFLS